MYEIFPKQDAKKFMDAFTEGVMDRKVFWLPTAVITLINKIDFHERKLRDDYLRGQERQEMIDRMDRYQLELNALKEERIPLRPNYFSILSYRKLPDQRSFNLWTGKAITPSKVHFPIEVNVSFAELTKPTLKFNYRQASRYNYYSVPEKELKKVNETHPIWFSFYSLISKEQLVFSRKELEEKAYVIDLE